MIAWLWVVAAIVAEVAVVTVLAAPPRHHRRVGQTAALAGLFGSVLCVVQALRDLPLEAVYGIRSAGGAAGIAIAAMVVLKSRSDRFTTAGIARLRR